MSMDCRVTVNEKLKMAAKDGLGLKQVDGDTFGGEPSATCAAATILDECAHRIPKSDSTDQSETTRKRVQRGRRRTESAPIQSSKELN
jgi:hypothetical protein